jgi:UDP-2,3-diacylglucosamine pyrophosphatase LpxH
VYDAVVISDLHLGSKNCQSGALVAFLEQVRDGRLPTRRLVLNGDVFDSIDFRRLRKQHWKVLSLLRKMSDEIEIVWINGNHDGSAEIVSHLLGVAVKDEFGVVTGGRRVLFLHGHQFDEFIDTYPVTTWVADRVYRLLQWIDGSHRFAKMAKKGSKTFLRCARRIEEKSREYARQLGCDAVCCGHTHFAAANTGGPVAYFNSGCWTETPCHYLTVSRGVIRVREFEAAAADPADYLASELVPST